MKCYVVQDLLPEYVEGLCREETAKEIKEHLAGCEECQRMWKNMSDSDEKNDEMELQKIQPFQRIKKRLRRIRGENGWQSRFSCWFVWCLVH